MHEEGIDLLIHGLVFLAYTTLTLLAAGLGMLFEYRSFLVLNGGDLFLGVWEGAVGLLFLAAASYVARNKLAGAYEELQA